MNYLDFSARQRFAVRVLAGALNRIAEAFELTPESARAMRQANRDALAAAVAPETPKTEPEARNP